ncbi:NAD(P)-dependent alcohol dehydrogenase [uncultured Phycicoccus sp.]|uniref:NAD(P)-dependent alcohol dehydrogenase n=1 Tax=uncultured Phycicoccus sp. TaxID=661422 RepID=UPI002601AAC5|nr:NAD(P)-dependent alcohol dehydrogenase [uncultured Phycicoccus sp.]
MKAVIQDRYGSSEVLRVDDVAVPEPGDHDVLIKVHAAGLDRGTEHLMTGKPYAMRMATGLRRPKMPISGRDVAGTVVRVGSAVTQFAAGDQVYGVAPGSFAEYAVGPENKLAHKPENLTFAQAAVVPISAGTALQALRDVGKLRAGQEVLIIGASGGVGSYAVQLAKILGARVTGVASAAKADFVRSLGADDVLDYDRDDFADGTRHYDLILDIGGGSSLRRLRRALTPRGTVVFVGSENTGNITGMGRQLRGAMMSLFVRQRLALLMAKERASDLQVLAEHLQAGQLTPSIAESYPLSHAKDAMRLLEAGRVRGKVVIIPKD